MANGEIARHEQFHLCPQCFQKSSAGGKGLKHIYIVAAIPFNMFFFLSNQTINPNGTLLITKGHVKGYILGFQPAGTHSALFLNYSTQHSSQASGYLPTIAKRKTN